MKRLILMRHAKSDWSGGVSSDHDRPLNARGREAAAGLGQWLHQNALIPDQVLSSSSARTHETCDLLALPKTTTCTFLRSLYLAPPQTILATLRTAQGECVLMLGHNPGIAECAEAIVSAPPEHPEFDRYPTGATLVAELDIDDWGSADWGSARVCDFVVPRDF